VLEEYLAAKEHLLLWSQELTVLAKRLGESTYRTLKSEKRFDGSRYHHITLNTEEKDTWYRPFEFTTAYSQQFLMEGVDKLLESRNQHILEYFNAKYHLHIGLSAKSSPKHLMQDDSLEAISRHIIDSLDGQSLVERGLAQIQDELAFYLEKAQRTKNGISFPWLKVGIEYYNNSHSKGCKALILALSYFLNGSLCEDTRVRQLFVGTFDYGKLMTFASQPSRLVGFRQYINGRLLLYFQSQDDVVDFMDMFASGRPAS
jgi:hypothetical protein